MGSSIQYKGYGSPTLHLVLLVFASGTALLCFGFIGEATWSTGVLGSMSAYIVATSASKAAEAYSAGKPAPTPGT